MCRRLQKHILELCDLVALDHIVTGGHAGIGVNGGIAIEHHAVILCQQGQVVSHLLPGGLLGLELSFHFIQRHELQLRDGCILAACRQVGGIQPLGAGPGGVKAGLQAGCFQIGYSLPVILRSGMRDRCAVCIGDGYRRDKNGQGQTDAAELSGHRKLPSSF